jgi:hypothetical protein
MSGKFLHPDFTGQGASQAERPAPPTAPPRRDGDSIDWWAARRSGRACCCPARPVVIVVMPPTPGRRHPTDLLLCWHHYRVSRKNLAAAGATVLDLNGAPVTGEAWPSALT